MYVGPQKVEAIVDEFFSSTRFKHLDGMTLKEAFLSGQWCMYIGEPSIRTPHPGRLAPLARRSTHLASQGTHGGS